MKKYKKPLLYLIFILLTLIQTPLQARWMQMITNGFGDPNNQQINDMIVFQDKIFASFQNWNGSQIYYSHDGINWTNNQASSNGWANPANTEVISFAIFKGDLYAATYNTLGTEIWSSPDGMVWAPANFSGFMDMGQEQAVLCSNNGYLFAGTYNSTWMDGSRVYRSDTPAPGNWSRLVSASNGFGISDNEQVSSLTVFNGDLYAGLRNGMTGSEIYKSANDGTNWIRIPAATNGFNSPGFPTHREVWSMHVFNGQLYAGTDMLSVFRSPDGDTWTEVRFGSGFGGQGIYDWTINNNELYMGTIDPFMWVGQLEKTSTGDPGDWTVIDNTGWGSWNNQENFSLITFKSSVFIGNRNWNGALIYSDLKFDYIFLDKKDSPEIFCLPGDTNLAVLGFSPDDPLGHDLDELKIHNLGTASNGRDITNMKIWYDYDKNGKWSTNDIFASGPAVWSNTEQYWHFTGLGLPIGTNYLITVDLTTNAFTNRNFRAYIPGGLTLGDAVCTNGGMSRIPVTNAHHLLIGNHFYSAGLTANIPSLSCGYIITNIISLRLEDNADHQISTIRITNLGTMASSNLNNFSPLDMYYDTDVSGTYNTGDWWIGTFDYNSSLNKYVYQANPPWPPMVLPNTNIVIRIRTDQEIIPGLTFRAAILPGDLLWEDGAFNPSIISNQGTLTWIDEVIPVKLTDIPATNVYAPLISRQVTALNFEINDIHNDRINRLWITNLGTAEAGIDFADTGVRLYLDNNANARYDAGETFRGTGTWLPAWGVWEIIPTITLFPLQDVNITFNLIPTARSNRTIRAGIIRNGARCTRGVKSLTMITNDFAITIFNTNEVITLRTNALQTGLFYTVTSNFQNKEVLSFHYLNTKSTSPLISLGVTNLGTMVQGSDISAISLYNDSGTLGKYDPGVDLFIGSLQPRNISMWTSHSLNIPEGTHILVTVNTTPGISTGTTFQASIARTNDAVSSRGIKTFNTLTNDDILTVDLEPPLTSALKPAYGSSDSLYLEWQTVTNSDLAGYMIALDSASHAGWTGYSLYTNVNSTNLLISGLAPSTAWHFRVRAVDSAGNTGPITPEGEQSTTGSFDLIMNQMGSDGFDQGWDTMQIDDQVVFQSNLFITGATWPIARVLKSPNGGVWTDTTNNGFGSSGMLMAPAAEVFNGQLYVGLDSSFGPPNNGTEMWRSPDGKTWQQVLSGGIGDNNQNAILDFAVFNGALYAGTSADWGFPAPGCYAWRSTDGSNWVRSSEEGFGTNINTDLHSLAEFNGRLYAGVDNNTTGSRIYSTGDGTNWDMLVQAGNGFGNPQNQVIQDLYVYKGSLYAALKNTWTGCEIWSSPNGTNWNRVVTRGFLDPANSGCHALTEYSNYLFAGTENWFGTGAKWFRTSDGTNWAEGNMSGFGDTGNQGIYSLGLFRGYLFAGTYNSTTGAELWSDIPLKIEVSRVSGIPGLGALPGSVNLSVLHFTVNDTVGNTFNRLRIRNLGTATTNDIQTLKLWYDTDASGSWTPADSQAGFPANWNSSKNYWEFLALGVPSFTNLILTVDLKAGAVTNRTFRAAIFTNSLQSSAGIWNTDTWATNTGTLRIVDMILHKPVVTWTSNLRPEFSWSYSAVMDTNLIQVSTNNFTSLLAWTLTTNTNWFPLTGLTEGTNTWRVISHRIGTSNWYTSYSAPFYIDRTPPLPVALSTPASNAWITDSTPELTWNMSSDQNGSGLNFYTLVVSSNADFSTTNVFTYIAWFQTNYTLPVLEERNWYWKVRIRDIAGNNAAWSPSWFFKVDATPPTAVTLISPSDGQWTPLPEPELKWKTTQDNYSGTALYEIQIGSNASFIPVYVQSNIFAPLTNVFMALPGDGDWLWRVRALDNAGLQGAWSPVRTLHQDTTGPDSPVLSIPSDGSISADNTPDAVWNIPDDHLGIGVSGYILQADDNADFSSVNFKITNSSLGNTNYTLAVLSDSTWHFRVQAFDSLTNYGPWSSTNSFILDTSPPAQVSLLTPASNSFTGDLSPAFSWSPSSDAQSGITGYILEVDNTSVAFGSIEASSNISGAGTTNAVLSLSAGTKFWRVRAINGAGSLSAFTAWNFDIDTAPPPAPVLVSPYSNSWINTSEVSLAWQTVTDPVSGISSYTLEISTNSSMAGSQLIHITPPLTNTNVMILDPVKTNWWRVKAIDGSGNSGSFSQPWFFLPDLAAPASVILYTPTNNTLTNDNTLDLSWSKGSDGKGIGITNYIIQIDDDPDFSSPDLTGTNYGFGNTNSTTPPLPDNDWYIRISAIDHLRNTPLNWSQTNRIRTDTNAPSIPSLYTPSDLTLTNSSPVVLFWSGSSDANGIQSYELDLNGTVTNTGLVTNWSTGALADGIHLWSVRPIDNAGNRSEWSSTNSFTVDTTSPPAVSLTSPASNIFLAVTSATLTWNASADAVSGTAFYIIQIDTADGFPSPAVLITNSLSLSLSGLIHNTTNWWRVKAVDHAQNTNSWSSTWMFGIDTNQIIPVQISPPSGIFTNGNDPEYVWSDESATGAGHYWIEIRSNNTGGPVIFSNTNTYSVSTQFSALSDGQYIWRVRAFKTNTSQWQVWSPPSTLTVDTLSPGTAVLISPPDNILTNSGNVMLSWNAASDINGIAYYEIDLDGTPTNAGPVLFYSASNLSDGPHTWAVRATDPAGNTGSWSGTNSFTNDTAGPSIPGLSSPLDGILTNVSSVALGWTPSADLHGISAYEIDLDGTLTNAGPVLSYSASNLSDGPHTWAVRALDSLGNTGSWSVTNSFSSDTTPPPPVSPSAPASNTALPTNRTVLAWNASIDALSGTAFYLIEIDDNPAFSSPTLFTTNGLSLNATNLLATNWWKVRAVDYAGNTNAWGSAWNFMVDTNQIIPSLVFLPDGVLTNENNPVFSWSDESSAGAGLYWIEIRTNTIAGELIYSNTNISGTSIQPVLFSDGIYAWRIRAFKTNTGKWQTWAGDFSFTVDTFNPSTPVLSAPIDSTLTNTGSPVLSWLASGDLNGIASYELDLNGSVTNLGGSLSYTAALGNGPHSWSVRALDNAGNSSSWSPANSITIDTTDPSLIFLYKPADGFKTNADSITLEWSQSTDGSGIAFYQMILNGSPTNLSTGTNLNLSSLTDGSYKWLLRAFDHAGNSGLWSATNTFLIDTVMPGPVSLYSPADGTLTNNASPGLVWQQASDPSGIAFYELDLNGTMTNIGNTTNWTAFSLSEGAHTWAVRSADNAGNVSDWSGTNSLTVDTLGPSASLLHYPQDGMLTNFSTSSFSWQQTSDVSGAASYELDLNGNMTNIVSTNWVSPALSDSAYTWRVRALDTAGNTGSWSATNSFTIDTAPPPAISLSTPVSNSTIAVLSDLLLWNVSADALSGTAFYISEIDDNPGFSSPLTHITNGLQAPVSGLSPTNWWRVKAVDNAGNTNTWSSAWNFMVDTNQIIPSLICPPNGTLTNSNSPEYSWSDEGSAGAGYYHIEVRTNNISGALMFEASNTYTVSTQFGALSDGSYVWRVRAYKTNTSQWQSWTGAYSFTVDSLDPAPAVLAVPLDSVLTNTDSPVLTWSAAADLNGISYYEVDLNGSKTNTGPSTSLTLSGLADGIYFWSIRPVDSAGNTGAWTGTNTFTVDTSVPAAPALWAPSDGSAGNAASPALVWQQAIDLNGIAWYELDLNGLTTNVGTLTNYSLPAGPDGVYNWSVRAVDSAGNTGDWSATNTFTVDTTAPPIITLNDPFSNSVSGTTNVLLIWNASADALSGTAFYILEQDTDPGFGSPVIFLTNSSSIPVNASSSTTNWWRVKAVDFAGNTNSWSSAWNFTIDTNQIIPGLSGPPDGVLTNTSNPLYSWTDISSLGAGRYWIEVRTNTIAGSLVFRSTNVPGTSQLLGVLNNGLYSWRVRAYNTNTSLWQSWSSVRTLTVDTLQPGVPSLLEPSDGSVWSNLSILSLIWSSSSDPNGISFYELDLNGSLTNTGTSTNLDLSSPPAGAVIWRVRAIDNAGNTGSWSTAWTLTNTVITQVTPPGPENDLSNVRIYPNPVYTGEDLMVEGLTGRADITLFSVRGLSISSETVENFNGLPYTFDMPDRLSSGLYILTFTNPEGDRAVRKVLFIKEARE